MLSSGNQSSQSFNYKRPIFIGTTIFILLVVFTLGGLKIWIKTEANSMAKNAVAVFHKNKTESLIALIDSDNYSLKDKNNAIWAFGVLKDKDALPKLESLYTGNECKHNEELCQYEIEKAIHKIKGNFRGSLHASK